MGDDLKTATSGIGNTVQTAATDVPQNASAQTIISDPTQTSQNTQSVQITVKPDSWAAATDGGDAAKQMTFTAPPSKDLEKITASAKSCGADLSGLLDEQGNIKPENFLEAKKRIETKAEEMRKTNALGAARLYDQAILLDPTHQDKKLRYTAAATYKEAADKATDPEVKRLHLEKAKTYLELSGYLKFWIPGPRSGMTQTPLRFTLYRDNSPRST